MLFFNASTDFAAVSNGKPPTSNDLAIGFLVICVLSAMIAG